MSQVSIHTARQLAGPSTGQVVMLYPNGTTPDIVSAVLDTIKGYGSQVAALAPMFQGNSDRATAHNIWQFIKANIAYRPDESGKQWILEPRRLLDQKYGDCKGYTIFTSSMLRALGIAHRVRFTSYAPGPVTHVYVVLNDGTPVDAVWNSFGSEKTYYSKKDYNMTQVARVSGVDSMYGAPLLEGSAELRLIEEQKRLERALGVKSNALVLSIEDDFSRRRANDKNAAGLRLATNANTPEEEAAVKTILVGVREAGPYFLYLFIKDKEVIKALPPEAAKQRQDAMEQARYIIRSAGISESLFMRLARVGIMQQLKQTPEQLLVGAAVSGHGGVGFIALLATAAAKILPKVLPKVVPVVKNVVNKAKQVFGNKSTAPAAPPTPTTAPAPLIDLPKLDPQQSQTLAASSSGGLSPSDQMALKDGGIQLDNPSAAPTKPFPVGLAVGGAAAVAVVGYFALQGNTPRGRKR